jgi:hypothetical protein
MNTLCTAVFRRKTDRTGCGATCKWAQRCTGCHAGAGIVLYNRHRRGKRYRRAEAHCVRTFIRVHTKACTPDRICQAGTADVCTTIHSLRLYTTDNEVMIRTQIVRVITTNSRTIQLRCKHRCDRCVAPD